MIMNNRGKIKFYLKEKGYGFIIAEDKEYFVHHKDILLDGPKVLNPGDIVDFQKSEYNGKECAINVTVIERAAV